MKTAMNSQQNSTTQIEKQGVRITYTYGTPVLALCGFSGSGKTTLLENAIAQLVAQGLSVAVVKHDSHGFEVDREGKDSDRFFRAGATVALRGPTQQFQRRTLSSSLSLQVTLDDLSRDHDLILVEGHKHTPLPKLWMESSGQVSVPEGVTGILASLPWGSDRLTAFMDYLKTWLPSEWKKRPLNRGMLIGGASSRMGVPKQLVQFGERQLGEIVVDALRAGSLNARVVALGLGPLPESQKDMYLFPDAIGFTGPLAGLMAAHRWAPEAAWIVAACDHPRLSAREIHWLESQRKPGRWAIIPRQDDGHPCPTLALYEPQALNFLARRAITFDWEETRLSSLLDHPRTVVLTPPEFLSGWSNANTPDELQSVLTRGTPFVELQRKRG
jgi:molybdopterin-guanine dinucleotide biosynthesis protein A